MPPDGEADICLASIELEASSHPSLAEMLHAWHLEDQSGIGGPALHFHEPAARHGAILLFRSAWCFLLGSTPPENVIPFLKPDFPHSSPSDLWSADLTLHWLPDIARLCRQSPEQQCLVQAIHLAAARWPLSAAALTAPAMPPPDPAAWHSLISHPGLRQLFTDRALAAQSTAQLAHSEIAATARLSLGTGFPQLTALLPPLPP